MFSEILITAEEQHGSSAGARPARWSGATRRPNRQIHGTTHRVAWENLTNADRRGLGWLRGWERMHTPAGWVAGIGTEQPRQEGKRL